MQRNWNLLKVPTLPQLSLVLKHQVSKQNFFLLAAILLNAAYFCISENCEKCTDPNFITSKEEGRTQVTLPAGFSEVKINLLCFNLSMGQYKRNSFFILQAKVTPALFVEGEVIDDKAIGKIEAGGKCTDAKVCVSPNVKTGN